MSITEVELSNFKCFVRLRLKFAPLSVLTGFNSGGKSTVLQSIHLITQGLRHDNGGGNLGLNGPIVRLGSAADVLSNAASTRDIGIGLRIATEAMDWRFGPVDARASEIPVAQGVVLGREGIKRAWSGRLWKPEHIGNEPTIVGLLKSIVSMRAVRVGPEDAYPAPDNDEIGHANVGKRGEFAAALYVRSADDEIEVARRHPDESASSLRRQVDANLNDLFPGAQVTADEIVGTSLVKLNLRIGQTSEWRRPVNVGLGIIYAFPVLVATLLAMPGQTVIIDSPEAHLHPRAQSRMGEILARVSAAGVQVVLETHSDHVLNGIRLAVKKGVVDKESVAIHFFRGAVGEQSNIISPIIDSNGSIDNWPVGFFDQTEIDLASLAGWA